MSYFNRRPLVRFDTSERASLVPSMPSASRRIIRRNRKSTKSRPRLLKGRVNIRVAGFPGLQKLSPSTLIPYLPLNKIRLAAGKALRASGRKRSRRFGRKRTKRVNRKKT